MYLILKKYRNILLIYNKNNSLFINNLKITLYIKINGKNQRRK